MDKIILIGFGGHARSVIDCIEKAGQYEVVGYTDHVQNTEYRDYRYLGNDDVLQQYYDQGIRHAFISVGYMGKSDLRSRLYKKVKEIGYALPVVTDPSAQLAGDVRVGEGSFVGKNAVINANARIGKMCIVNTGAIVEHDCIADDFSHISVGSVLCGHVRVGTGSFVGANATLIQERVIGKNCIVAAGAVVRRNLDDGTIFYSDNIAKLS